MFFQQQVISIPQKKIKSKALRDNEISHINLTRIMNEEKKYYKPKECIGMIKSQRSDIESNNQTENGKRLAIDEVIQKITI